MIFSLYLSINNLKDMTKLDKIVKDMIEHANNAGTEVKEKEYVSIFHFYDELNKK